MLEPVMASIAADVPFSTSSDHVSSDQDCKMLHLIVPTTYLGSPVEGRSQETGSRPLGAEAKRTRVGRWRCRGSRCAACAGSPCAPGTASASRCEYRQRCTARPLAAREAPGSPASGSE